VAAGIKAWATQRKILDAALISYGDTPCFLESDGLGSVRSFRRVYTKVTPLNWKKGGAMLLPAASSGSPSKAPGFAGGYLLNGNKTKSRSFVALEQTTTHATKKTSAPKNVENK
jgi:hypothetical protein